MIQRMFDGVLYVCRNWRIFLVGYLFLLFASSAIYAVAVQNPTIFNPTVLLAPWIIFALIAAFGDAAVGFIDEWLLEKLDQQKSSVEVNAPGRLLLISGFFGGVTALGAVLVTLAFTNFSLSTFESFTIAVIAGVLEVIWMIPYFYALDRGGAINTTPLFQTIPIFSFLIAWIFLTELPLLVHLIAAALIVSGGLLLNYSPSNQKLDTKLVFMMLGSALVISVGYFVFLEAVEQGNFITAVIGNGVGMVLFSFAIWTIYKPFRQQFNEFIRTGSFRIFAYQAGNESLYALSTMAAQFAIVLGPSVMIVTALNAFHPIFTLIIGAALAAAGSSDHKESFIGARKITTVLGIVLIAVGTALIAF